MHITSMFHLSLTPRQHLLRNVAWKNVCTAAVHTERIHVFVPMYFCMYSHLPAYAFACAHRH